MFPQFPLITSITILAVYRIVITHSLLCWSLPPSTPNLSCAHSLTFTHTCANIKIVSRPGWVSNKLVYGISMYVCVTVSGAQILSKTLKVGKRWPYLIL